MVSSVFMITLGTKTGLALGLAVIALPVALYVAITRPILFPVGLYVVLIPFDNLLSISSWGTLTRLVAICSGLAVAFWAVRKRQILPLRRPVVLWGLFILWAAATFSWALDLSPYAQASLATLVQLYLLYAALSLIPITDRDLNSIFLCVIFGAVAAAAFGLYLYTHGMANYGGRLYINLGATSSHTLSQDRINPNAFAAALLLPMSLTLMQFLSARRLWGKVAWSSLTLLLLTAMVASGSRGSLLAVACIVAFFLWKSRYRMQLLPVVICGAIGSLFVTSIWERFSTALSTGGAGRLSIWMVGMQAFKKYWLLGAGLGNFQDAYDRAYISVYQQINAHWSRPAHNIILGAAVELGVIGLTILLFAWFSQYKILSTNDKHNAYYDVAIALQGALVGSFVASLFSDSMYDKYTWLVFMLTMLTAGRIAQSSRISTGSLVSVRSTVVANPTLAPARTPIQDLQLRR